MKLKEKEKELVEHVYEKSLLRSCPFLGSWFEAKIKEIKKSAKIPRRKGIPRGSPIPTPLDKKILMIFQIIYPRLGLNKFAEALGLSYGTVRNWNIEEAFNKKKLSMVKEFSDIYFEKLTGLIETHDAGVVQQLEKHINELHFYQNYMMLFIIQDRFQTYKVKDEFFPRYYIAANFISFACLGREDIGDPEMHRKLVKQWHEGLRMGHEATFDRLISAIRNGKYEFALEIATIMKNGFNDNLWPAFIEMALELYDGETKGQRRNFDEKT